MSPPMRAREAGYLSIYFAVISRLRVNVSAEFYSAALSSQERPPEASDQVEVMDRQNKNRSQGL
jgi:hypothetical protein